MGIPQNKTELLLAIETNFSKLFKALQAVPESRVREPTLDGDSKGTTMSVANLLAYLIGWNELLIKWIERDAAELLSNLVYGVRRHSCLTPPGPVLRP